MKYNLIIEEAEEGGFIGYVPEIPGANTQGETEEEVRQNIVEAIQLIQEVRKEEALNALKGNSNYLLESIEL
jgi:predicted RNase H-like HicB family nuclease